MINKLKEMIKEPASKEWFAKHGTPKSKALKSKMTLEEFREIKKKYNQRNPYPREPQNEEHPATRHHYD